MHTYTGLDLFKAPTAALKVVTWDHQEMLHEQIGSSGVPVNTFTFKTKADEISFSNVILVPKVYISRD